jgi:hypothetical protein
VVAINGPRGAATRPLAAPGGRSAKAWPARSGRLTRSALGAKLVQGLTEQLKLRRYGFPGADGWRLCVREAA